MKVFISFAKLYLNNLTQFISLLCVSNLWYPQSGVISQRIDDFRKMDKHELEDIKNEYSSGKIKEFISNKFSHSVFHLAPIPLRSIFLISHRLNSFPFLTLLKSTIIQSGSIYFPFGQLKNGNKTAR